MIISCADDHLIHHAQGFQNPLLVLIGKGGAALLVSPENLGRGEGNGEKIPELLGLAEELHMPGVNDVVTTGDENMSHDPATMKLEQTHDKNSLHLPAE